METKDLIGLVLLLVAVPASVAVNCLSRTVRDCAFFVMVAATVISHKLEINFFSHFWYRGTTRGLEVSFVDLLAIGVLVSSFLLPRPGRTRWYWPGSLGLMLLYFAYACASVLFAEPKVYGLFELSKMFRGLVFFLAAALFVRSQRELAILIFALGCAVCFEGALAFKQRLLDGLYRVPGSLDHPNSLSMYLCTVAPLLVAAAGSTLARWLRWFSATAVAAATVSSVLTVSRAGIPIFAFVVLGTTAVCVSWRITPKKIAAVALISLCLAGLIFKSWDILKARYAQDTLEEEYLDASAFESRGYFLRLAKIIVDDRFAGVGLNNWSYWVSKKYGAQLGTPYEDYDDLDYAPTKEILSSISYAAPAHNLAALTVGELGVPGLALFALLWLRWFQMGASFLRPRVPDAMRRLGVGMFFGTCGIFLQGITEWVFRQTHIFLTFHVLLGALASLYWCKRKSKRLVVEPRAVREEETAEYEPVHA